MSLTSRKCRAFAFKRWLALALVSILFTGFAAQAAPKKYLYRLEKPISEKVGIGLPGKIVHYGYWGAEFIPKIKLGMGVGAQVAGAVGLSGDNAGYQAAVFAIVTVWSVGLLRIHTVGDLAVRKGMQAGKVLNTLKSIRGVERAFVVQSGVVEYGGLLGMFAKRMNLNNNVFIETNEKLTAESFSSEQLERFGAPQEIENPEATKMTFKLMVNGTQHEFTWETTLADFFAGKPLPDSIAKEWRSELKRWDKESKKWQTAHKDKVPEFVQGVPSWNYLSGKHDMSVQIDATIELPSGETQEIEAVIISGQIRKLLGMTALQRVKDFFLQRVLGRELKERALSVSQRKLLPVKSCEEALTPDSPNGLPLSLEGT